MFPSMLNRRSPTVNFTTLEADELTENMREAGLERALYHQSTHHIMCNNSLDHVLPHKKEDLSVVDIRHFHHHMCCSHNKILPSPHVAAVTTDRPRDWNPKQKKNSHGHSTQLPITEVGCASRDNAPRSTAWKMCAGRNNSAISSLRLGKASEVRPKAGQD